MVGLERSFRINASRATGMIVYLKHAEIDKKRWDNCIRSCQGVKPYGYSWYLDIMTPGWEALVDGNYESVFPIPGLKKYGIHYISTPVFMQQLGVYSTCGQTPEVIDMFLDKIPDYYRFIDLCVGQKINNKGYTVTERVNYELDLSGSYDTIWQNFSSGCRKNIKKSITESPEIVSNVSPADLIGLFLSNKGKEIKGIKSYNYKRLDTLMNFCIRNKKGRIIGMRDSEGKLVFGRFLLEQEGRIITLFTANTAESRTKRTGYYVINELIKEFSSTMTILDFEGSSIPSIASFMESFGCVRVPFYRIYRNRLPWPVRFFK